MRQWNAPYNAVVMVCCILPRAYIALPESRYPLHVCSEGWSHEVGFCATCCMVCGSLKEYYTIYNAAGGEQCIVCFWGGPYQYLSQSGSINPQVKVRIGRSAIRMGDS